MDLLAHGRWLGMTAALCAALCLPPAPVRAQDARNLQLYEQKIKAGLLYNFLKYAHWPDSAVSKNAKALSVCLYGGDPFEGYLYPLEGKTAQQYPIRIKRVSKVEDTESCSLVFIHQNSETSLPQLFSFLTDKPVLTASDIKGFARQGGMVEMATENDQIVLYINEEAARSSSIQIQARLLKLARSVSTKKG